MTLSTKCRSCDKPRMFGSVYCYNHHWQKPLGGLQ